MGDDPLQAGGPHWPYRASWWERGAEGPGPYEVALVLTEWRRVAPRSWCPVPGRSMRRTGIPAARLDAFAALAAEVGAPLYVVLVHAHEGEARGDPAGGFPEDQRNWLSGELVAFCGYDDLVVWAWHAR